MKKLLIAGMLLTSFAAIHASNNNAKQISDEMNYAKGVYNLNDTTPTDTTGKDTTTDSAHFTALAYNYASLRDTLPSDTTSKDTTSDTSFAVAFRK